MVGMDKISFNEYIHKKKINNTNFLINYEHLCNPSTLIFKTKIQKKPKVQMEHYQELIIDLNITHKRKNIYFD
jgi:hypothetical protein